MTCFSRVFIRRSRPSALALVSNENHQASCQGRIRMKARKGPRVLIKSRWWHKMIRCQAEITRHVTPAALAILIYIRGYIYPAASMAMYSTQSAQDRLPPDSTPALWFLTQRSAAWQHHESCPTECTRDEIPFFRTACTFDFCTAKATALRDLKRTCAVRCFDFIFLIVNKGLGPDYGLMQPTILCWCLYKPNGLYMHWQNCVVTL